MFPHSGHQPSVGQPGENQLLVRGESSSYDHSRDHPGTETKAERIFLLTLNISRFLWLKAFLRSDPFLKVWLEAAESFHTDTATPV